MSMILDRGLTEQQMREKLAREDRRSWRKGNCFPNAIYNKENDEMCVCSTSAQADTILRMAHSFDGLVEMLREAQDVLIGARTRLMTFGKPHFEIDEEIKKIDDALRAANLEKVK